MFKNFQTKISLINSFNNWQNITLAKNFFKYYFLASCKLWKFPAAKWRNQFDWNFDIRKSTQIHFKFRYLFFISEIIGREIILNLFRMPYVPNIEWYNQAGFFEVFPQKLRILKYFAILHCLSFFVFFSPLVHFFEWSNDSIKKSYCHIIKYIFIVWSSNFIQMFINYNKKFRHKIIRLIIKDDTPIGRISISDSVVFEFFINF